MTNARKGMQPQNATASNGKPWMKPTATEQWWKGASDWKSSWAQKGNEDPWASYHKDGGASGSGAAWSINGGGAGGDSSSATRAAPFTPIMPTKTVPRAPLPFKFG